MVTSVTSLGRNGVADWLVQRFSAIVIASYTLFLLGYFFCHPDLNYEQWSALFQNTFMRLFTLLTLLSIAAHAMIGVWTVATDYVKSAYCRIVIQIFLVLALFVFVFWSVQILWGA